MFSQLKSLGLYGLDAYIVGVEADISQGLPSFDIVGLPDAAVKESRERVRSSLRNCGFDFPVSRITINLSPADIKKEGPVYDLPILIALLCATRQLNGDFSDCVFAGELSLSGEIRRVSGILPMAIKAKEAGFKRFFIPYDNAAEGSVVDGIEIFPVKNVPDLINHLNNKKSFFLLQNTNFPKKRILSLLTFLMFAGSLKHGGLLK
jgi:Lon protease (S16) C-terminal proteolytic domain.